MHKILLDWKISLFLLITASGWVWISRDSTNQGGSTENAIPQVGFIAPEIILDDLYGQEYVLSHLQGKAVIINFWASWCPPCREEMPAIERVYQDYAPNGLVVLAVNATNQDTLDNAREFVTQMGFTIPILLDTNGSASETYLVRSLPTTYFINPLGIIEEIVIGGPMAEALLRVRVENLLEENMP